MIKLTFENLVVENNFEAKIAIPGGNGGKQVIIETDSKYLWLCMVGIKDEALLYIPKGKYVFTIPEGEFCAAFEQDRFLSEFTISAKIATDEEIYTRRNIALNPFDAQFDSEINPYDAADYVNPTFSAAIDNDEVLCFPHIYGNRITRHEGCFHARNVIDGISTKGGHGRYPYHSWGTSQCKDANIIIYFGREVEVDMVSLALRSDYALMPNGVEHDTYWPSATIEFSDGTELLIHPVKTGDYQDFSFEKKTITWLRLKELVPERTDNFASLNQINIYGYDK